MRCLPRQLHGRSFDLVVIGAGIQGAAIARDAAVRGLTTLLVDARDVAAGTSSRSSQLVHGGLRYLRQGHLSLVREALHERERLLRAAPHLVRPQPMLIPFFDDGGGSPLLLRLGTWAYSLLAGRSTLPAPRKLSAEAAAQAFPGLRTRGLRSAIEFFDARTQDARLTLANVLAAASAGCLVATHTEVVDATGAGLRLHDRIAGDDVVVRAARIVNAAGPGVDTVRRRLGCTSEPLIRQSRGSHVVLPAREGEVALAAFLPDERIQFVIPHPGGTLCGTTDVDCELDGDETGPPSADLDYLSDALAFLLDPAPRRVDVLFAYAGWRSLPRVSGPPGALNREAFVVDEQLAGGMLHTVVGGKLTTHRSLAERVVGRLLGAREGSPTRHQPLPGGDGPREVDDELWWRHGSRVGLIRTLVAEHRNWVEPLCPHRPFLCAELVHALRNEGAVTFADVVLRRLVHVAGPCQQEPCLLRAHELFLRERRWPVDDCATTAVQNLRAELRVLCGDLASWQVASTAGGPT